VPWCLPWLWPSYCLSGPCWNLPRVNDTPILIYLFYFPSGFWTGAGLSNGRRGSHFHMFMAVGLLGRGAILPPGLVHHKYLTQSLLVRDYSLIRLFADSRFSSCYIMNDTYLYLIGNTAICIGYDCRNLIGDDHSCMFRSGHKTTFDISLN
jgi:hypothetical protein